MLSRVFATPWIVAHQAPLSMEFSRQKYWRGLPFSFPGDLPNPGIKPGSPALQAAASLLSEPPEKPLNISLFWLFTNLWMDIWVVPSLELWEYSCTNRTVGTSLCFSWLYLWKWSQWVSINLPLWGDGKLYSKMTISRRLHSCSTFPLFSSYAVLFPSGFILFSDVGLLFLC